MIMMKNLATIFTCLLFWAVSNAQEADKVIVINDMTSNPPPSSFSKEVRFHIKWNASIGVPSNGTAGVDTYSGLMTVAPWSDGSASKHHQLNFNEAGLFWRKGSFDSSWEPWKRILVMDADGNVILGQGGRGIYWDWPSRIIEQYSPDGGTSQVLRFRNSMSGGSGNVNGGFDFAWHDGVSVLRIINGRVGIGTVDPDSKLAVNGSIHAEEVRVDMNVAEGPDYVFHPNYELLPLSQVKSYVEAEGHLPEVPSANEMAERGLNLKQMNLLLLKKVEELTLHLIEQNEINANQAQEIDHLKEKVEMLESESRKKYFPPPRTETTAK